MGGVQTRPAYRGLLVNFCQELKLSHVILCIGNNSHPYLDISLGYIFIFQGSTMAFCGSHNNRQGFISEISFSPKRKSNKFIRQGPILSPCLFNFYAEYIMRNAGLEEHKLESRLLGEISITSDMQMTPPLWQKVKRN